MTDLITICKYNVQEKDDKILCSNYVGNYKYWVLKKYCKYCGRRKEMRNLPLPEAILISARERSY